MENRQSALLIIEQAMAEALKIGILYLFAELLADAFVVFCACKAAGAVASGALKSLFNGFYYLFVGVESYFHVVILLLMAAASRFLGRLFAPQ